MVLLDANAPETIGYINNVYEEEEEYFNEDGFEETRYVSAIFSSDGSLEALGIACAYEDGTIKRNGQWEFWANRHRTLWIEYLWSKEAHFKESVVEELEQCLRDNHLGKVLFPNIYVLAGPKTIDFYEKSGYALIETPSFEDREYDDPSDFIDSCDLLWMAKSMTLPFPSEETRMVKESLQLVVNFHMRSHYAKYFTKPFAMERFIRCLEDGEWDEEIFEASIDQDDDLWTTF
jgi:hypothetical protein